MGQAILTPNFLVPRTATQPGCENLMPPAFGIKVKQIATTVRTNETAVIKRSIVASRDTIIGVSLVEPCIGKEEVRCQSDFAVRYHTTNDVGDASVMMTKMASDCVSSCLNIEMNVQTRREYVTERNA